MLIELLTVAAASLAVQDAGGRLNLSEALFNASVRASGSKLCDRKLSRRLERRFAARFGTRLRLLQATHVARFGPDPDFIVTTECHLLYPGYDQGQEFRRFDRLLRRYERSYGLRAR